MSHRCVLVRFLATGDGELNMEQAICLSSLESRLYGLLFHMIFGQAVCTVSHSCTCIATHTRAWYMNADDLVDRVGHTSVLSVLNYRWEQIGFYLACLCSHTREYMYMHVQLQHLLVSTYVVCERLSVMHEPAGVVENLVQILQNTPILKFRIPPPPPKIEI